MQHDGSYHAAPAPVINARATIASEYDAFFPTYMGPIQRLLDHYSGARYRYRLTARSIYSVCVQLAFQSFSHNTRFAVSVAAIAEIAGCSESTIQRYFREFVAIGLLRVEERRTGDGGNLTNIYWVRRVEQAELPAAPPVPERAPVAAPAPPETTEAPALALVPSPDMRGPRLLRLQARFRVPHDELYRLAVEHQDEAGAIDWIRLESACFAYREQARR